MAVDKIKVSSGVAISTVSSDVRGKITAIVRDGFEYTLIETKAGFSRGGDYHPVDQHSILLRGKASWTLKMGTGPESKLVETAARPNVDFIVKKGTSHYLTSLTDSLVLVWLDGGKFIVEHDKELRSHVDKLMRKDTVS
jgi:hypothetical protein